MEPVARVGVTVTFLRMDRHAGRAGAAAAAGSSRALGRPSVAFYRYLYDTVGADTSGGCDARAGRHWRRCCAIRRFRSTFCMRGGEPAGSSSWMARGRPDVNLSYFGLMPHAVGTGVGFPFLRGGGRGLARRRARHDGEHLHRRSSARAADLSCGRAFARCARCASCGTFR